jgi:sec-independent protein translocase protein TatA
MGSLSIWHWLIVLVVVMVMFGGRGKISSLMGDLAQGIKAFKKGMSEDDKAEADKAKDAPVKTIDHSPVPGASTNAATEMKARSETERKFEGGTV